MVFIRKVLKKGIMLFSSDPSTQAHCEWSTDRKWCDRMDSRRNNFLMSSFKSFASLSLQWTTCIDRIPIVIHHFRKRIMCICVHIKAQNLLDSIRWTLHWTISFVHAQPCRYLHNCWVSLPYITLRHIPPRKTIFENKEKFSS